MGTIYKTGQLKKNSYSSINTFEQCPFKFFLQYVEGHYISVDSLASDFGTLCHHILESIGLDLKFGRKIDYEKYKKEFAEVNIPKKDAFDRKGGIYGINVLKKKYTREFFEADSNGQSFQTKALDFMNRGIYSLENYMKSHPDWRVWGCEHYFDVTFDNHRFGGYIDRILFNEKTGEYLVEDIKTKGHPFKDDELVTPLQFVVYVKALAEVTGVPESKIHCAYDLPICDMRQDAGTKGFVKRGVDKINKIFAQIENKDFKPNPSPLCWWCQFNHGNPNIPEAAKGLCPYYSLWRPDSKTYDVANIWEGMERHKIIVQRLDNKKTDCIMDLDF